MNLLPPPLSRSYATVVRSKPEGDGGQQSLICQVLQAYSTLPFKGKKLVLPGDVVACEDLWLSALDSELKARADDGLEALRDFNLEVWLCRKVDGEGSLQQRRDLQDLKDRLDRAEEDAVGLPPDLAAVVQQPLVEIPVYRSLDVPLDDDDDEAEDAEDEDDAPPRGGRSL